MIRNEGAFLIGHNLDMPMALPGMVVVNKRCVTKQSITHMELISGQEQPFDKVVWVSKFGSITFNPLGKEFADGGIN